MAGDDLTISDTSCPFIDLNDHRCASSFTLGRLDRAFDLCLRRPLGCQVFYRIALEQRRGDLSTRAQGSLAPGAGAAVALTLRGHAIKPAPAPYARAG